MKFLTEESPAKVISLLGVALTSMAFLFGVTLTNANFQGTETAVVSPFDPSNVVAMMDNASAGYSNFLQANLFRPAESDFAYLQDTGRWIIGNSDQQILAYTGLSSLAQVDEPAAGQVAGAYTDVASSQQYQPADNSYGSIGLFQFLGIQ